MVEVVARSSASFRMEGGIGGVKEGKKKEGGKEIEREGEGKSR